MTDSLTRRAEAMLDLMEQMKAIDDKIAEMCPRNSDPEGRYRDPCGKCPMRKECLGDGHLDIGMNYDMEKFADYVDYCDRVQDGRNEADASDAWESANRWAGIDPSWAILPRIARI